MPDQREDWRRTAAERLLSYREVLEDLDRARDTHNRRNGLYGDDYSRPGLTVEIPLFWGTF